MACRFHIDAALPSLPKMGGSVLWVPVGQKHNREHGEDDPIGAETVTAPATVSGEVCAKRHWATGKAA
jgi:hypothetical protein